jgi:hypothetical protein
MAGSEPALEPRTALETEDRLALRGRAAGIDEATPQGYRRQVARGEEATQGAPTARCHPAR